MIKIIPIHWIKLTFSLKRKYAIRTETGSSSADTMLPRPIPVRGKPALNNKGGIIVPKSASIIPHFMKISKLKGVVCVAIANPVTIKAPPRSMYKLRCAEETCVAKRLAVNMVVVKEVAAKSPKTIPRQSNSTLL